ncbi:uncharacterized protein LOC115625971 [Scaptodrosophila lebanonensis]|uniref:Uncharacterized protein LOC115625971 n=1 Tax=Drosophila lebanonensis TaxID=7225 RepID=A0A6J2TNH9_DROLE|nr:uncharacterized protein LOC115625971 [Scaptodrosophila lebanonensis]
MYSIDINQYGSSVQCCVCVYDKMQALQAAQLDPEIKNKEDVNNNEQQLENKTNNCLPIKQQYVDDVDELAGSLQNVQLRESPQTLITCKICKMQQYCLSHAGADVDMPHRDMCLVLQELQQVLNISHPLLLHGAIKNAHQLHITTGQLKLALIVKLQRPLSPRENDLICYPAYCMVCYRLESLTACTACGGVAYCSGEHRQLDEVNHKSMCNSLRIYYNPYKLLSLEPEPIKTFYESLDLQSSHLVEAFHRATHLDVTSDPQSLKTLAGYQRFATCSSFSCIASICLALTHVHLECRPGKMVKIYIVGAGEEQLKYFEEMHLKFFFLQYHDVCILELFFVGQRLLPRSKKLIQFMFKGLQRTVIKQTYAMTFRQFTDTYYIHPTLLVLYHPDLAQMSTLTEQLADIQSDDHCWYNCLVSVLQAHGVPICYTSATKVQARSDYLALSVVADEYDINIKSVYNFTENPYRGILPQRNFSPNDSETLIYANNYLEVIFSNCILVSLNIN